MSVDTAAEKILSLPDKGTFFHRQMIWQADWIDTDIATYAELKAMANLWVTVQSVAPILMQCWSLNPEDEFYDKDAKRYVNQIIDALVG